MKRLRFVMMMCLCSGGLSGLTGAVAQQWSDPVTIGPGNNPDLYIDRRTGEVHVVSVIDKKGVLYIRTDKVGNKLDSVIVPNTQMDEGMEKFGPSIAVDQQGYPHIGFRDHTTNNKYDIFYTRKTASGWSASKKIAGNVLRGYVVRLAVDREDNVHFAHGSSVEADNTGPVNYYLLKDGSIVFEQHNIMKIRGDERFEFDVSSDKIVDLVTGDLSYPNTGGPIYYYRSKAPGDSLIYRGDLHAGTARGGSNGSPDLFKDDSGNTHVCYGTEQDFAINKTPSIRYHRIANGITQFDKCVTDQGEIAITASYPIGIASVASNEGGDKVLIAYTNNLNGPLFARLSEDGGESWGDAHYLAGGWDAALARNKHIVRSYRSDFYVVYPSSDGIKLRYLKLTPNELPVAELATPDSAAEGSPVAFDASASQDADGIIRAYYWDFQNDGSYDDTTTTPFTSYIYPDDFEDSVKMRVVDDMGDESTASAPVHVYNVAPIADAGGPYVASWYTPAQVEGAAFDPGILDQLQFEWDLDDDGIFESIGKTAQTPAFAKEDTHRVILRVSDKDGASDIDTAYVIIDNQAPVVKNIFDQMINEGESFSPILLNAFVDDPDNPDSTLTWSITGYSELSVSIDDNQVAHITPPFPAWVGSETLTFTATDPAGASDSDDAVFSITAVNHPPEIASIPPQSRLEGERFADIYLDAFVSDPDDPDSSLMWTYVGEEFFTVDIVDRILTVAVIDSEWAGTDTIGLMVSDPEGLKDTTLVAFTVFPINDWPVVSQIENQEIFQNQEFEPIFLDDYVFDPDDHDSLITWSWIGSNRLVFELLPGRILQIHHPDSLWTGSETVVIQATDRNGLSDDCFTTFTVKFGVDVADAGEKGVPDHFQLHQNYPNPFNPRTWIPFDIRNQTHVSLVIYNQLGHLVRHLVDMNHRPGSYRALWDGRDDRGTSVSSGIYFYRIEAGDFVMTRKMVLIY